MCAEAAPVRTRPARPYDAAALLELKHQLDRETAFMMYEPGERDSPVQDLAAELAVLARSANSVVLLAEREDQLIGYVQLTGGTLRRSRATAYVVIGVLAHAAGRGTGTELLRQAKAWAAAHGLHRLELTVMAHNARAIRLYERTGFTVEGRRSECLLVDGQFIDELTMAALLPTPPPPAPLPRPHPFTCATPSPLYPPRPPPLTGPASHSLILASPPRSPPAAPRPGVRVPLPTFLRGLSATACVSKDRNHSTSFPSITSFPGDTSCPHVSPDDPARFREPAAARSAHCPPPRRAP